MKVNYCCCAGCMADAVGAGMTVVVSLAAGWWDEKWCAAADDDGQLLCMTVTCLSAGSS